VGKGPVCSDAHIIAKGQQTSEAGGGASSRCLLVCDRGACPGVGDGGAGKGSGLFPVEQSNEYQPRRNPEQVENSTNDAADWDDDAKARG
jgi:hypothetical protein